MAATANAELKFKSLNNYDGKTTVVLIDDNFEGGAEMCCARFNNDGKTYDGKSMVTTQRDNKMSVTMTFKHMTVFNNMSISLTINGQDVTVPISLEEVADQLSGYKLFVP